MITQQQITTALEQLPEQFSIGELVDKLVSLPSTQDAFPRAAPSATPQQVQSGDAPAVSPVMPFAVVKEVERAYSYYTSPDAQAVYANYPSPSQVRALRGIAAGLPLEDMQKTAKEWDAERIQERYGV